MQRSYFINTYGCQMNVHESEKIAGILGRLGMNAAQNMENADIIVYNTCCIRQTAEAKIFGALGRAKKLKEVNPSIKIVLCGCLPQQPDILDTLKKRFQYVDLIIGTHNIPLLGEYLKVLDNKGGRMFEIWGESGCVDSEVEPKRAEGIKAYINIMYGCNNFCSYCIVPYVRGRERSVPFDAVIKQAENLIKNGYKEITLLGQNVNSYNYEGQNFASLLSALNNISRERFKIKFMTSHPKDLSEEVVRVIAQGGNMAKYIHLPVQAGSNRILQLMNRKYTREDYLGKIDMIRSYIPDAGITSDIMVGFPSESKQDFFDTVSLVERARFNNIYSFIYNRRSGTEADKMSEQINKDIKIERIEHLIKLQNNIGASIAQEYLNKNFCVLIEEKKKNICFGKTENDMAISFNSNANVGEFVDIRVSGYKNTKLTGTVDGELINDAD